ncbi:DUF2061 domain-containing protein [Aequorivita sediminis]|uniref:DUF2061 domain-containing protein n=1 Tax=Aequorivita sediminis TaxID=3073653 RepID=UPI0028A89380|nr:DUF2061 domain-containing protein [Aequorivita sp. F6058]
MKDPSRKRHIAKALTWRIVGSVDTVFLSWLITGNPMTGLKIGFAEVITKMVLYYLHERVWFNINLSKSGLVRENKMRHLAKTVTWRMVGTADTMVLAWLLTGNPLTGVKIGLAELLTKMILYYIHERIWYRIDYGLVDRVEM